MLKLILSVVGGLVVAFALVAIADASFHALSATSARPADPSDADAMREYVAGQPVGILAALVAGWMVAAFSGAAIAARFGGRGEAAGWAVTFLFLLATAANFVLVEHPIWMVAAAIVGITAAGWLGSRTGARTDAPLRP